MAPYQPIIGTLGYIMHPDGQHVLLIHRNARLEDQHYGKYNGLGGKLEAGEDVLTGMRREIFEEAGITCEQVTLRGTISWPGFGKNGEDWLGFIFRIDAWSGTPFDANHEGTLEWVLISRIPELNMWDNDRLWIAMVFDDNPAPFFGVAPYEDGVMLSWSYVRT